MPSTYASTPTPSEIQLGCAISASPDAITIRLQPTDAAPAQLEADYAAGAVQLPDYQIHQELLHYNPYHNASDIVDAMRAANALSESERRRAGRCLAQAARNFTSQTSGGRISCRISVSVDRPAFHQPQVHAQRQPSLLRL